MLVTKISSLSGRENTRDVPCTEAQIRAWQGGGLIQDVMPQVSDEDREFLISGVTPEEWDSLMSTLVED